MPPSRSQGSGAHPQAAPGPACLPNGEPFELPVRPDWLGTYSEPALDPGMQIIDAHHHLWDRPAGRYLFEDYLCDIRESGHTIVGSIFVQCRAMYRAAGPEHLRCIGETEFVTGVAAMSASGIYGPDRLCAAIVGFGDLRSGAAVRDVLEAQIGAAGGRLRGIRQITAWDDDPMAYLPSLATVPHVLNEPRFREGFAQLAPLGLSFDAWLMAPQIDELTELAGAFPETRIILDHIGTPLGVGRYAGRTDSVARWRNAIGRLAAYDNVFVKLGGMGQRVAGPIWPRRDRPPTSRELADDWADYFHHCIDAFSPDRCLFESNFPVCKASFGYGVFWNACKRIAARYSRTEQEALFSGTATRAYRMTEAPGA